jgi:hypothetical protein
VTEDLLEGLYVLYEIMNCSSSVRQNLYQPILGLLVTITLEFLDKYRM